MDKILTTTAASKHVGRTPQTIRLWIKEGKLKAIKGDYSRRFKILESDLVDFMKTM